MLVKRAEMVEIECVARGYISGSGLEGIPQQRHRMRHPAARRPARERQAARADLHAGHQGADAATTRTFRSTACARWWARIWRARLRDLTLAIYTRAARVRRDAGIIIADTKFEFGFVDGELVLGDEVLTPDSSRFWPAETLPARRRAVLLRQAVRARLPGIDSLEQAAAGPAAAGGSGAQDQREIPAGVPGAHGPRAMNWLDVVLLIVLVGSVVTSFSQGPGARSGRTGFRGRGAGAGDLVLWHGRLAVCCPM